MLKCIILGSGNSIQEALDKNLRDLLKNEITFTLNEEFRFFDSTVTMFNDWTFYKCRYKLLQNHPLIIGRFDPHIGAYNRETLELYCSRLPQLIMLPSCGKYYGLNSWNKGFYSGVMLGLFSLTLAIALGFDEIFLCGFDGKSINGKTHHYEGQEGYGKFVDEEGNPRSGVGITRGNYNTRVFNKDRIDWNRDFWDKYKDELKRIKIYNVSPESTIDAFPKISYDEFIAMIKENPANINQNEIRDYIKNYIIAHAHFEMNPIN